MSGDSDRGRWQKRERRACAARRLDSQWENYDLLVLDDPEVVEVEELPQPMATVAIPKAMARTSNFFMGVSE